RRLGVEKGSQARAVAGEVHGGDSLARHRDPRTIPSDSCNCQELDPDLMDERDLDMRISQEMVNSGLSHLDAVDRQIVAALQVEGRRSYTKLGADIGVSESVVRYRVQRMEREGILQIV